MLNITLCTSFICGMLQCDHLPESMHILLSLNVLFYCYIYSLQEDATWESQKSPIRL